jgi:Protein of unknown function, DUF488
MVRISHFKSAPGVSNVTSSRHLFCCCRNCARGLPGRRKAGVRGCGDPRTVRRWQVGGRLDGHSSAGPLWRTRPSSGSAGFDRNARPLTTVSDYIHRWRIGRTRGDMSPVIVLTIGHSTRSIDEFIRLLAAHGVDRLVDIRTIPRSRRNPQFSRDLLSAALAPRGDSVHAHARFGRTPTLRAGLGEQWMAQCRLPRVCRLHADRDLRKKSGAMYRSCERRADRADVRGGRSMAVSSLARRRRPAGQRRRCERDHQWRSHSPALPHAMGRGQGSDNHLSQRGCFT